MTGALQTGHSRTCPVTSFGLKSETGTLAADSILSPSLERVSPQNLSSEIFSSLSDAALVARLGEDPGALACLYDRYASLVYAIALRVLRETTAAEDVVNDVFLRLWRSPESFDEGRGKMASWLTVITRNRSLDVLRKRRGEADVPVEEAPPSAISTISPRYFAADFEKAQRIMNGLPAEQRKAIELAYFDGLSQSEISDRLGEPLGTVKSRIRLGMNALKKALS